MKFESKLTKEMVLIAAIAFVDDADLLAEGTDSESMMQLMLKTHDDLHAATGGYIEQDKSKFYAWKWKWRQGNKVIKDEKVTLEVNEKILKPTLSKQSERTLGVHMNPSLKWEVQFKKNDRKNERGDA